MVEPEHDLGRNIEEQDENLLQVADQNSNLLHVEEDQDGDQFLDLEQEEHDDEQMAGLEKRTRNFIRFGKRSRTDYPEQQHRRISNFLRFGRSYSPQLSAENKPRCQDILPAYICIRLTPISSAKRRPQQYLRFGR
ncbi:uncharacterized protein LOC111708354 [Eurytemora carolleeae]|uniref:uncharacterized protein LOC111708354 n=1 Tax=Eurytemora carolleeae TaxID=1294199 RepID=UPI000C7739D1|nr:uncharacterized protein LOC111708354 [Eurytemora carolleeae]|eukprot:XP_023337458.1 uncharacterized protein LOC111708354 [Eurytemora affinis]